MQWGMALSRPNNNSVTFPCKFPSQLFIIMQTDGGNGGIAFGVSKVSLTGASFVPVTSDAHLRWLTIGK